MKVGGGGHIHLSTLRRGTAPGHVLLMRGQLSGSTEKNKSAKQQQKQTKSCVQTSCKGYVGSKCLVSKNDSILLSGVVARKSYATLLTT